MSILDQLTLRLENRFFVHQRIRWDLIEQDLGFVLPADYKIFAESISPGLIHNEFEIYTPSSVWKRSELQEGVRRDEWQLSFLEPPYFEPDLKTGIVGSKKLLKSFGCDGYGDSFFWLMNGQPDNWLVVLINFRDSEMCCTGLRFSEFLLSLLDKKPIEEWFTDVSYPEDQPIFVAQQ